MKKKMKMSFLVAAALILSLIILNSGRPSHILAATDVGIGSAQACPYVLDLSNPQVKVEIADILFTDFVQGSTGNSMRVPDNKKDKFRLALVTLKITKPMDRRISLAAADLTLHYCHGDKTEAAPCEGISIFSTNNNSDRPVLLSNSPGPGWIKQTCGAKCTKSEVVYLDAVFASVEPDTNGCWICVAQPATTRPYMCPSPAWTNN